MQKNDIDKRLEESAINTAVADMMDAQGEELWNECQHAINEDDAVHPDNVRKAEFDKALKKANRNSNIANFFKRIAKPAKYAVTSLAVVVVAFSVCVISVDAFRIRFIDWLMKLNDTHITVDTVDQDAVNYNDDIKTDDILCTIPDGYDLQSTISETGIVTITYENLNKNYIVITKLSDSQTINMDSENSLKREDISINNSDGLFIEKDNGKKIIWSTGKSAFVIFTNDPQITKNKLIEIAESVK